MGLLQNLAAVAIALDYGSHHTLEHLHLRLVDELLRYWVAIGTCAVETLAQDSV